MEIICIFIDFLGNIDSRVEKTISKMRDNVFKNIVKNYKCSVFMVR